MGKRRMAREMAMQMLFQGDLGDSPLPVVIGAFDPEEYARQLASEDPEAVPPSPAAEELRDAFAYSRRLAEGVHAHLAEIDALIRTQAEHWRLERMPSVDRNILRLSVYEMLYEADVPKLVVVDEAVELAKRFGSEQSGRFVNGLLDGLMRSHPLPGSRE